MPKVMLINVTHSEESRVGILNDGVLEAFEIESLGRSFLKGNIYKGVVHRIHPALEAAFVDIGGERDAFLPLDEICFKNFDERPVPSGRGDGAEGGRRQLRIRDVLRPGQELLVQITKEQFANKPPTVSTFYSLPGRYLVLLPGSDDTGISRRIEGEERDRLKKIVDDLKPESGFGLIVRTVAGLEENGNDLPRDLDYLKRLWSSVQTAATHQPAPALVYREHDIVQRAIRDFYTPDISQIYIDDEEVYDRATEFLTAFMPGNEAVLNLYRGEQPMFSAFKAEEQIDAVFERRVRLRSGGSIVIDGTEALTAIDVNSGGAVRGANPEETAFRTNREAASEVARQMRLRDIGGIIVVDFIDMRESQHIREIEQLVRAEMRTDKARHETSRITDLGLMEISRQRLRPAAANTSHATCPLCQGFGSVRASASAALAAIRKIHSRMSLGDVESMRVTIPSAVGLHLLNQKRADLAHLEARYESIVEIRLSDTLLPHEVEIEVKERSRTTSNGKAVEPGRVAEAREPAKRPPSSPSGQRSESRRPPQQSSTGEDGAPARKRRRRRRRRGGGSADGEAAAANQDGSAGAPSDASSTQDSTARESSSESSDGTAQSTREASRDVSPRRDSQEGRDRQPRPSDAAPDAANGDGAQASDSGRDDASSRPRRSRGRRGGRRRSGARAGRPEQGTTGSSGESATSASDDRDSGRSGSAGSAQPTGAAGGSSTPAAPAPTATVPSPSPAAQDSPSAAEPAAAKRSTRKSATKATATKKAAAKKTTTKAASKKVAAKKPAAKKKTTTRKSAVKKPAAKKKTTKKTTKKATAKKVTAKKAAAERPSDDG